MSISLNVLDSITIPTPCTVPWDSMHGDDRTRHCTKCSENVHDISELTTVEAVRLLSVEGKLPCLRIYRRPDGRVMTADCMTKRERTHRWLQKRSTWAAACFSFIFLASCDGSNHSIAGEPCILDPKANSVVDPPAFQSIAGGAAAVAATDLKIGTDK